MLEATHAAKIIISSAIATAPIKNFVADFAPSASLLAKKRWYILASPIINKNPGKQKLIISMKE